MQYTRPTTQSEMYAALKEIFYYYRIRREGYDGVTLQNLELERMAYMPLSNSELLLKAQKLNASKHFAFEEEYLAKTNAELAVVEAKLNALPQNKSEKISAINSNFNESVNKLNLAISKNGLSGSSIAVDKLALLEVERNKLLNDTETEYQTQTTVLMAERNNLLQKLQGASEYCEAIIQKENEAKQKELSDEQAKTIREVFKYNNGLDEKEQRYANNILQTNASLELKFLEIRAGEYTKDQLVEMGYYEDVISCVCDYYDTLSAVVAAQQIKNDKKIIEYLDDYYESVIFMYQERAM